MLTTPLTNHQTAVQGFITALDALSSEPVRQEVYAKNSHATLETAGYDLAQAIDQAEAAVKPGILSDLADILNEPANVLVGYYKSSHRFSEIEGMRELTRQGPVNDIAIANIEWAINLDRAYTLLDTFTDTHSITLT